MTENLKISPEMFKESTDHYNSLQSRIERNEADRIRLAKEWLELGVLDVRYLKNKDGRWTINNNDYGGFYVEYLSRGLFGTCSDYENFDVMTLKELIESHHIKDVPVRFEVCDVCHGNHKDYSIDGRECVECNGSGYVPISPEGAVE